jgi:hypothetical protein
MAIPVSDHGVDQEDWFGDRSNRDKGVVALWREKAGDRRDSTDRSG